MTKRRSIQELGAGILSSLEEMNNADLEQKHEGDNKEMSIKKSEDESKRVKEQKSKRSFMLTEEQIQKLYSLKLKYTGKDLSVIVGEAIEMYYEKYNDEIV